ncbi:MAG: 2OG-Fe(II) oxygenase family protein [Gammaproteobacteria bacterium]|nr:2OG-Fe(II) oxygenase family protein [Gammaproteobacteria bacterium]
MPSFKLSARFPTPIADMILPQSERLNRPLAERFLAWERDEPERSSIPTQVPKHAVYESDFSLFSRDDPTVRELARLCLERLGELIMHLNHYSVAEMRSLRIFHHSWYHVTRRGGYTSVHNHPMACWSGVYCVTPGETPSGTTDNGALCFLDPRPNPATYTDPGNAYLQEGFAAGNLAWQLVPGQLLLFPSWLLHEVRPFWGRDERITVAFNAWVRPAGASVDEPGVLLRHPAAEQA